MSQLPQNNEEFDDNPEYTKLYQANDSLQSDPDNTDDWSQRVSEQPSDERRIQDGKKAANVSLLLVLSASCFSFWGAGCFSMILQVVVCGWSSLRRC